MQCLSAFFPHVDETSAVVHLVFSYDGDLSVILVVWMCVDRGHTSLRSSSALVSSCYLTSWWIKSVRYAWSAEWRRQFCWQF